MKFLCVGCDQRMELDDRVLPGDGTLAAAFRCPSCQATIAMLANPMEARLVSALGVQIGGETVSDEALLGVRSSMEMGTEAKSLGGPVGPRTESGMSAAGSRTGSVRWSVEAIERLEGVPRFVRGMVKRLYSEYASERGIEEITPAVMDRARTELGLEGM